MLIVLGPFLGIIVFLFTFIASKKSGKYYLAPIVTFLLSLLITAFSIIVVGGWEGMAFFILAVGVFIVSLIGTLLLAIFMRTKEAKPYSAKDKIGLIALPIILFVVFGSLIYFDKGYWIIDEGAIDAEVNKNEQSFYDTSTIVEGRKQLFLQLGDEYRGKKIIVNKISKWGPTTVTVEIIEGEGDQLPNIKIGLDRIRKPLTVKTTDGIIFEPYDDVVP